MKSLKDNTVQKFCTHFRDIRMSVVHNFSSENRRNYTSIFLIVASQINVFIFFCIYMLNSSKINLSRMKEGTKEQRSAYIVVKEGQCLNEEH